MKIKLFTFIAAIAAVCCMLAVFVSASDRTSITYKDVDNVTHEVPIVKYDDATANTVASVLGNNSTMQECFADDSSYVILKATDGSLTAYPTWYIIEPYGTNTQYVAISEIEYGYVNSKSDKTYEKGALQVDISETEYSSVSISITGFKDDYSSIELVFALYAYTDPSEVDFIQSQHTVCAKTSIVKADATLYTVSLDSVKKATAATSEYVVPAKEEIE